MGRKRANAKRMSKTFKNLNIVVEPENLEHLFADESVADLLDFFCNTITRDNYIPTGMREACGLVDNIGVTHAKGLIEQEFPGIFDYTKLDVENLESELKEKELLLQQLEQLSEESSENNRTIDKEILQLEETNIELSSKVHTAVEECEKLALESDNLRTILNQRHSNIREQYDLLPSGNFGKTFFENAKHISNLLHPLIKNSANQSLFALNDPYSNFPLFKSTLGFLRKSIEVACEKKIALQMEESYLVAKLDALVTNRIPVYPDNLIDEEIAKLEAKKNTAELQLKRNMNQIAAIESDKIMSQFLEKYFTANFNNTIHIKENIQILTAETELFWKYNLFFASLQSYVEELTENFQNRSSKIVNLFDEANSNLENSLIQMNNVIHEFDNNQASNPEQFLIQNTFFQYLLKLTNCDSLNLLLANVVRQKIELQEIKTKLFQTDHHLFQKCFGKSHRELMSIHQKLYKSQVYQLQTLDIRILNLIHQLKTMLIKHSERCSQFSKDFKAKVTKPISFSDIEVNDRMLWAYFLIEPKKVLKLLNKTSEKKQNC